MGRGNIGDRDGPYREYQGFEEVNPMQETLFQKHRSKFVFVLMLTVLLSVAAYYALQCHQLYIESVVADAKTEALVEYQQALNAQKTEAQAKFDDLRERYVANLAVENENDSELLSELRYSQGVIKAQRTKLGEYYDVVMELARLEQAYRPKGKNAPAQEILDFIAQVQKEFEDQSSPFLPLGVQQ
ncbi:MAG: hypothetical protein KDD62_09830 [Bdellovibrionales bacterium]|nr:hypothetical protein [Bdellovibrionales bacterium]